MYLNIILANPSRHKCKFKDEIIHVKSVAYVEEMKSHVPDKPPFRDVIFIHPIDRDDRYVGDFIEMQEVPSHVQINTLMQMDIRE